MPLAGCGHSTNQTEAKLHAAISTLRLLRQRCEERWCAVNKVDDDVSIALRKQVVDTLEILSSTCAKATSASAQRGSVLKSRTPHFVNPALDTSLLSSKLPPGASRIDV
jgi:hypothetical protein